MPVSSKYDLAKEGGPKHETACLFSSHSSDASLPWKQTETGLHCLGCLLSLFVRKQWLRIFQKACTGVTEGWDWQSREKFVVQSPIISILGGTWYLSTSLQHFRVTHTARTAGCVAMVAVAVTVCTLAGVGQVFPQDCDAFGSLVV